MLFLRLKNSIKNYPLICFLSFYFYEKLAEKQRKNVDNLIIIFTFKFLSTRPPFQKYFPPQNLISFS